MSDMEDAMREGRIHMDCGQFRKVVGELDRSSGEVELSEEALLHAESCNSCAALLTETESLDFALRRIAGEASRSAAPPRVEAALLQEFRRTHATSAHGRLQRRTAAFGVAAALLLAAGLALRHRSVPISEPARAIEIGLQAGAGPSQRNEIPAQNIPLNAEPVKPGNGAVPSSQSTGKTEVAQEFTPLPYADDPSMIEGGAVVRVIMSRSALASFGVPLSGVEGRERFPADLVVSADGTPEAIRLVAEKVN
jgi:hypothetical protein